MKKKLAVILSAVFAAGLIGCGGNPCADLRPQCNSCKDQTLKTTCDALANAGVVEACQNAMKDQRYAPKKANGEFTACADSCPELQKVCDACQNPGTKSGCNQTATSGDSSVCSGTINSGGYASDSAACKP